jgi:protein SCO1/2
MGMAACSRTPTFRGTALDPPRATLDFTLTDQAGRTVRWSEFHGRVVVLTFLYTSCRDVCPLVAGELREASELLGDRRRDVAIVAVTVDPTRDTVARAAIYSRDWRMLDRWEFLTGREAELAPLWRYYWAGDVHREAVGTPLAGYDVAHTAPLHLIDRHGRVRVVYGSDVRPAELVHDVELLLADG